MYLVLVLQYWEDAAFAREHSNYGGPLRQDSKLALFVKHRALFLFGGLNEITHSEINDSSAWVCFGELCHSQEEWNHMIDDTREAHKQGQVLQDNTREVYQLEARAEWDAVNLHMGSYEGFPCPCYCDDSCPGDLKGKECFPTPKEPPMLTPAEY